MSAEFVTRDELKRAALRAVIAALPLTAWGAGWRSKGFPTALALGLVLALVVFATSLVERVGARRAWSVPRIALLVGLVGAVGALGAVLQARATGFDLLQGDVARLEKELATLWVAKGLRFPAAFGAVLASGAAAACARRGGVAALILLVGGVGSYPALVGIMGPLSTTPEWLLFVLHVGGAVLLGLELLAWRPVSGEPAAPRGEWKGVDVGLVVGVLLLLMIPRGGRLAQEIRRANDQAEAQRRLELALATSDARAAIVHLDASIELWDDPRARLERGLRHAALGSIADAESDFGMAELRPGHWHEEDEGLPAEAFAAWGDALFFDYDRALTALDKYAGVVTEFEQRPWLAESHAGLLRHALARSAALHVALRDDLLAQQDATRLLELEFQAPSAWLRRGVVRAIAGDVEGARADLARAADSSSVDGAHAALWTAALWGEGGARLDALVVQPGWLGAAGRMLAPRSDEIVSNERDLFAGALASRDDPEGALASAQAWLGAQAERAGDMKGARERYTAAVAACARRAPAGIARPHPGDHLGGLWAWRRLEALR